MLDKTLFKKCLILNARNKIKLTSLCKYTQKLQKTTYCIGYPGFLLFFNTELMVKVEK